ncbi:MAG: 50S ribosomal protein L10 [Planctomycetota bacterium]|nr:50S ribosomal protein L10 [Planctomycetota bacterium]
MSKYVKNLIMRDLAERLKGVDSLGVINPRGINAIKNNQIRRKLRQAGLKMTVVKNSLAKRSLTDGQLKGFESLLDGPSALIYGAKTSVSTIARLMLDQKKTDEKIELRGMYFDGEVYLGEKGVQQVSKLPTREEAVANIVAAILSPGRKLGGILKDQAGKIAAILKTVEERAKEKEAAATPVAAAPEAAPTA